MNVSRHRPLRLLAAISVAIALGACHITLNADYDATVDQGLATCQKDVAALLEKMIENTTAADNRHTADSYQSDADAYTKINAELDALAARAAAHAKNEPTVDAIGRLKHSFDEFQTEHKTSIAPMSIEHVTNELNGFNHEFSALMATELLKK
jgi:hypothetical protein